MKRHMQKKQLKKIRKMKKNEEMTLSINDETIDIICIDKQQYLIFTTNGFYEINYNELIQKYQ